MAGYIGPVNAGITSQAQSKRVFAPTTTTTVFSFAHDALSLQVFHNGVRLVKDTDYTANGTAVTLTSAAENGDQVVLISNPSFQVADTYTQAEADGRFTSKSGDTMTGSLVGVTQMGIGTTSPEFPLDIQSDSSANAIQVIGRSSDNIGQITFTSNDKATDYLDIQARSSDLRFQGRGTIPMTFHTDLTERMRIDSSGNLLVGMTSYASSSVGTTMQSGLLTSARSGNIAGYFNRLSSDGSLVSFAKDGSTAGSIGTLNADPWIARANGCGVRFITAAYLPTNASGNDSDNVVDIGMSSVRFDDIYATNGTIQTSDRNEKQQIASLTTAEMDAAKAISQLFKTFKWNDSVTANGDAARTHAGVIAQEVETAMTDAGLDAGDYAFFISSTWWETQTDVPAVAAVAEVLDDDGNVVTEAVEAKDAYTRTDTYETAEEAPEGATERTRLGIRYPELLSFVGAATEQRLAAIETRLTALEAV